ncbi:MAG TPA: quinone oxidoreductase [Candidatus Sulfomarinibacteraceae bacterium]|nr:quinone oxidoreductase [Candidatus Sulfomarinibacteraceae bacterium]
MQMQAIRVHKYGGPEALRLDEIPAPEPGEGQVRVRLGAVGVNFIDVYHRTGAYQSELPIIPGREGAGVVDAVGRGVSGVQEGDRVAFAMVPGTYAQYVVVDAENPAPLPEGVSEEQGAALMLQGMTAHYLVHSTYPLQEGDTCLVLAAAGGVGHLLVQLAKKRGARVIGAASTPEKIAFALEAGADEMIRYTEVDFQEETMRLTDGRGVDVVYDSVGKDTFQQSLRCLRPRGYLVLYGQSSGAVTPMDPQILNRHGSLFLTRPSLGHYIRDRKELLWRAGDLFEGVKDGSLTVRIDRTFPLAEAADAHRYLEGRNTKGKILLLP